MITYETTVAGGKITIQHKEMTEIIKLISVLGKIPETCPINGEPVHLDYRVVKGYEYYRVIDATNTYYLKLGIYNDGSGHLFLTPQWMQWDGREEVPVSGNTNTQSHTSNKGSCPHCHAPHGRMHATDCPSVATTVGPDSLDEVGELNPHENGPLISMFNDQDVRFEENTINMILRLRALDAESQGKMMTEKQYGYASGLVDQIVGKGNHKTVFAVIFGRNINHESPPGSQAKELIDWLKNHNAVTKACLGEIFAKAKEYQP